MDLRERRQLGGINRADKPKPWNTDDGSEYGMIGRRFTNQWIRAFDDVPFDFCIRHFSGDRRHKQAGHRAADGDQ